MGHEPIVKSGKFPFHFEPGHNYWIIRLSGALQQVLGARTIEEAHQYAKEELAVTSHPIDGVKDIDPETVVEWRVAVARHEQETGKETDGGA